MHGANVYCPALLLTLGAGACRSAAEEPRARTAVPVAVAHAVRDSLVEEIVVTGRLAPTPGHDAVLTAAAAGVVRRVAAPVGTAVIAGQLVIALDVPELAATARQQAVAAAQAEREASRQRQLFADGLTSRRGLEEAEAAAQTAAAAAGAAKELLARTEVRSPIAGRIQRIAVQQGTRVDAGAPLAEVIASDSLDLIAAVEANGLARLHLGQPASVTGEGDPTPHAGQVVALAPRWTRSPTPVRCSFACPIARAGSARVPRRARGSRSACDMARSWCRTPRWSSPATGRRCSWWATTPSPASDWWPWASASTTEPR